MKESIAIPRIVRLVGLLAILIPILCGAGSSATSVGDQVELKATHQAGVPFHQEPRGTNDFQRIPDGTRAQVIDTAKGAQCKPRQNILYTSAEINRLYAAPECLYAV